MKTINKQRLILASRSPRRKKLLEQVGISIHIAPSNIDETVVSNKTPEEQARQLSLLKAEKTAFSYPDSWILGADTIVVVKNQILGKPESKTHAVHMLKRLSNREHSVYTAFCVLNLKTETRVVKTIKTKVVFKRLTDWEISWYIQTGEPFDKAGSYAIQGIGLFMVKEIFGSYSNVVGLPVCEVVETLENLNIIQLKGDNHYDIY